MRSELKKRRMRWIRRASVLVLWLAVLPSWAVAQEEPLPPFDGSVQTRLLEDLALDRAEPGVAQWRLSQFVATAGRPGPPTPRAVYIQFGFMSCGPCHTLARLATDHLEGRVELVYIHLDDVEQDATEEHNQALWGRFMGFMQEREEYRAFVGLRRGNTALMRSLTGRAHAPAALLILPDGRWRTVPVPSLAGPVFEAFLTELAE